MAHAATLKLHPYGEHLLVDAAINDRPAHMVFDTGAFTSTLTPAAVDRLGLIVERTGVGEIYGVGGTRTANIVKAHTLQLGGLKTREFRFVSADIGFSRMPVPIDGLLSTDLLSKLDVDLDFPEHQAILYLPIGDCHSAAAALQPPLYQVPLIYRADRRPVVTVTVNGHAFEALIDTGAPGNLIYQRSARRMGITADILATDRQIAAGGVGPQRVAAAIHVFPAVTVGDLIVRNMPASVLYEPARDEIDMVLGSDFQRRVHLWISNSSHALIMQYPPRPSPKVQK